MAQIPARGAGSTDTIISDYVIEHLSVDVSDTETGRFEFQKDHFEIPVIVFYNLTDASNYHTNIYLTEVTNIANVATGSITIAGGTSTSALNGDTFTLTDKNATDQIFTFNNTDDVLTGGSIGLLSATSDSNIANAIKSSINNVSSLKITATNITVGSSVAATGTVTLDNVGIANFYDTVVRITDADGVLKRYILKNLATSDTGTTVSLDPGSGAVNHVVIGIQGLNYETAVAQLVSGINGSSGHNGSITASDQNGGVLGLTQGEPSSGNGADGNVLIVAQSTYLDGSDDWATYGIGSTSGFSGGGNNQTIDLLQDLTGSAGNTAIDMSSVTGGSAVNFTSGNNYGSGSFASSETFTGTLKMRAVSLRRDYKK